MKEKEITIQKGQYLTEVLSEIPTNTILCKTLTGLGATYSEIKSARNSIIVEPNVPVITGKCDDPKHKDDNLFGVKEGVTTDDIIEYLEKSLYKKKHFKLLTTPESYNKIKVAFQELNLDMQYDCFILYDECHKVIKDSDYRSDITLPMDDFFNCENKAIVSATPIIPSDPRFEKQQFQLLRMTPDYDYSQSIMLLPTNNVLESLKRVLPQLQAMKEYPICFFVNSTDMIFQIMDKLQILDDSAVFCSPKSVDKLKGLQFKSAYSDWRKERVHRYNFFTSRFYTALDIELEQQPNVVFLTDVYFADYTMIDPFTDAIQAIGRFRNGTSNRLHIYNTNREFPIRTRDGIQEFIIGNRSAYQALEKLYQVATTVETRNAYRNAYESLPYNEFLDSNGCENYFAIDNYTDDAMMRNHYQNYNGVIQAYSSIKLFNVNAYKAHYFPFGDFDRFTLQSKSGNIREKRKEIVRQLEMLKDDLHTDIARAYISDLRFADDFIVAAYFELGKEVIEQLKYRKKSINEAMILKRYREKTEGTEFIELLKNSFQIGSKYSLATIKNELKRLFGLVKTAPLNAITAQLIKKFFEVSECKVKGERGFLIVRAKI